MICVSVKKVVHFTMRTPINLNLLLLIIILCPSLSLFFTKAQPPSLEEFKKKENKDFWRHKGRKELAKELGNAINQNVAKNVILFIGDGMGMTSITAARHLKEQLTGVSQLTMETFPHIALSQVRSI